MVVFPGSPPVPPCPPLSSGIPLFRILCPPGSPLFVVLGFWGFPLSSPGTLVFGVSGTPFFGVFGTLKFTPFLVLRVPSGIHSLFGTPFWSFPLVSNPCAVPEGDQSIVCDTFENSQKRVFWGGVKKCQKRVKKGGKSKMTFSKCGRRGQNSPYPPTSHEKSAK